MNLSTLIMLLFLIVTFCFDCGIAVSNDDTKNLVFVGTPNKYVSPQLYLFGGFGNGGILSSASHFNSSTGRWKTTTDMAINRTLPCGVAIGTKIYLFGGGNGAYLRTAEVYDSETGTYSQYRSLPSPRIACAAAVLDGYIYVAGGFDGSNQNRLSSVIRYNIQTTRVEEVNPMHIARDALQLVVLSGRLYAIGGWRPGSITTSVEMYNPSTDQWKAVASTQFVHSYFGATAHEGGIYVCSLAGCEMYSPVIDKWTAFASPPNNFTGRTLVSMNHKLWALGGNPSKADATRSVFTYDTFTEKWSQQPDMNVPRRDHVSFVVNH